MPGAEGCVVGAEHRGAWSVCVHHGHTPGHGVANKPHDTFRHYPPHPLSYIIVSPDGPNDPRARVYRAASLFFDSDSQPWKRSLSPAIFIIDARYYHAYTHTVRDTVRYFTSANNWCPGIKGRNNRRICGRRRLKDRRRIYRRALSSLSPPPPRVQGEIRRSSSSSWNHLNLLQCSSQVVKTN